MHVDDRLATVLDARADGDVTMRIQYRQLIDLLGTTPSAARSDMLDQAFVRLAELSEAISAQDRAAALAEPGVRLRNARLVAGLSAEPAPVRDAAIRHARLGEDAWLDLIPALSADARALLRQRTDLPAGVTARLDSLGVHRGALPPGKNAAPAAVPAPPQQPAVAAAPHMAETPSAPPASPGETPPNPAFSDADGIGALVRRIEAFRRSREGLAPAGSVPAQEGDAPRLPLDDAAPARTEQAQTFGFATDATGRIGWAEAGVAPMVVGLPLPAQDVPGGSLRETMHHRQPIRGAVVDLAGAPAISGPWRIDAGPDFDSEGRFRGYVGRFRRPAPPQVAVQNGEFDRIRQILHELRTPVNAIQGFAEVIQQQLFGPTPHEYRALAAGIAADAARILAGFSELDRLARLDGGSLELESGSCDLAMTVAGTVHQLEAFTGTRASGFSLVAPPGELRVMLSSEDAEQLVWRLLATMAGAARPGEIVALELSAQGAMGHLRATLPEALGSLDDLFDAAPPAAPQAVSAGMFGSGFAFRLAAAEAKAAGGALDRDGAVIDLSIPVCAPDLPPLSADSLTLVVAEPSPARESLGASPGR